MDQDGSELQGARLKKIYRGAARERTLKIVRWGSDDPGVLLCNPNAGRLCFDNLELNVTELSGKLQCGMCSFHVKILARVSTSSRDGVCLDAFPQSCFFAELRWTS